MDKELPVYTFICIHCGAKKYIWEKEEHAREAHGYKEIPKAPRTKKLKQPLLPGIEEKSERD